MTNGTHNPDFDCKIWIKILQKECTLNMVLYKCDLFLLCYAASKTYHDVKYK